MVEICLRNMWGVIPDSEWVILRHHGSEGLLGQRSVAKLSPLAPSSYLPCGVLGKLVVQKKVLLLQASG